MQTPSHFLITAALRKFFNSVPIVRSAVLLGSVAPDIPLIFLSILSYSYFHYFLGWPSGEAFRYIYDVSFFQNPIWIVSHNTLQAPFILIGGVVALWRMKGNRAIAGDWWFWFLTACLLHAFIDILTHNDDGPLLFFPFDWDYRFSSPVSYWDRRYYGAIFSRYERILDITLIFYLTGPWLWRKGREMFLRICSWSK